MESIIQIFRMTEISVQARIRIIMTLGKAINMQYGSNLTEELVYELVLQLDPNHKIKTDEHYLIFINSNMDN